MCLAVEYRRWSHVTQTEGDSQRRQNSKAEEFAKFHNLNLIQKTYEDKAVSGWSTTFEERAVKAILDDYKKGEFPSGTVIILEQLDRLTREELDVAYPLVCRILKSGLRIGHCRKNRILTPADMKGFGAMEFLAELITANEESNRKSERIKASMMKNKNNARSGIIWTSKGPAWLKLNDARNGWIVLKEEAAKVKMIYRLCIAGMGIESICKKLVKEGTPPMPGSKSWNRGYILQILRSRIACGDYTPDARKGSTKTIAGYYERIIDDPTYYKAQAAIDARVRLGAGGQTTKFVNLFSGLCFDKDTGSTFWLAGKPQRDGSVQKRIYPSASKNAPGHYWSMPLATLEKYVLDFLPSVTLDKEPDENGQVLEGLQAKKTTLENRIKKINATIADPDTNFDSAMAMAATLETSLKAVCADIEAIRAKTAEKPIDALQSAKEAIKTKDRLLIRAKLQKCIKRIEISPTSLTIIGHNFTHTVKYESIAVFEALQA